MQDLVLQLTSEQQAVLGVQNATRQIQINLQGQRVSASCNLSECRPAECRRACVIDGSKDVLLVQLPQTAVDLAHEQASKLLQDAGQVRILGLLEPPRAHERLSTSL